MKLSDFLLNIGQPVPYYPALARIFGVKAAVFLCRFAWWHGRQADPDGWIYKTQPEITEETGMSAEEQNSARKVLKAAKVLQEKHDRLRHKMHYRIDFDTLNEAWLGLFPETGFPGFGNTGNPVSTNPANPVSTQGAEETQGTPTTAAPTAGGVESNGFHKAFIEEWGAAYENDRGVPYQFNGAKDGAAAKRLKSAGEVDDLIALARLAWRARGPKFWNCEKAVTIAMFASRLNEIRAELTKSGDWQPPSAGAKAEPKF